MNVRLRPDATFWRARWGLKATALADAPLHVVDGYQFLSAGEYESMIRQVTAPMGLRAGDRLIECGCGAGAFLDAVDRASPGLSLSGIDLADEMIAVAMRRLPHLAFATGDVRSLDAVADHSVDHSAAFAVLCYLDDLAQATDALEELVRITRPGGCILLGDTSHARNVEESAAFLASAWAPDPIPPYLYFEPAFFEEFAAERGLEVEITPMAALDLPTYRPRAFRYSVYLRT